MPIIETILLGAAGSALWDANKTTAQGILDYLKTKKPDVVESVEAAAASGDDAKALDELSGTLEIAAASGEISIEGALIQAIRNATLDHQLGRIEVAGATIDAPALTTGGGEGATGKTVIGGGTELKSRGTAIKVGQGARIVISGDASIKQN